MDTLFGELPVSSVKRAALSSFASSFELICTPPHFVAVVVVACFKF